MPRRCGQRRLAPVLAASTDHRAAPTSGAISAGVCGIFDQGRGPRGDLVSAAQADQLARRLRSTPRAYRRPAGQQLRPRLRHRPRGPKTDPARRETARAARCGATARPCGAVVVDKPVHRRHQNTDIAGCRPQAQAAPAVRETAQTPRHPPPRGRCGQTPQTRLADIRWRGRQDDLACGTPHPYSNSARGPPHALICACTTGTVKSGRSIISPRNGSWCHIGARANILAVKVQQGFGGQQNIRLDRHCAPAA